MHKRVGGIRVPPKSESAESELADARDLGKF